MDRMIEGEVQIIASRAIEIEVGRKDRGPEGLRKAQEFHQQLRAQPSFESYDEGPAIRTLARRLQDRLQESGRVGGYADLIHLATAIAGRASEFWTTDKKVVNWHAEGVIPEIRICRPYLEQDVLDL